MSAPLLEKILRLKQKGWRRRHSRHRADFALRASALRDDGYLQIQGRCSDIGHGGMGTVLTEEALEGEVLALEFELPNTADRLAIRAIVRYRKGFMHGLEFLGLSPEQQSAIDRYCVDLETLD